MSTDSSSDSSPTVTAFGVLLREHRRAAGLTQAELAERAGLSWRGVTDLERGARRTPHRDTLARLVAALNLTGDERAALEAAARRPAATAPTGSSVAAESVAGREAPQLPLPPTVLLGREQELAVLAALLRRDDVRLVTVTGPAGVGKTRLGVQVAVTVRDAFADGVWFVRLSRLVDPTLVVSTIAQTLGLQETGSQPIAEVLRTHLAERHLLLVLDNFEQVVGAAPDIAALLATSPGLKVLVTSRAVLHVRGERTYPVLPLGLPPAPGHGPWSSPERLAQYAAVALFVQRAGDAQPAFTLTTATAPVVAEICARLDGLPLAIELAAARVKVLPPAALLARLSSRLLTGGARDLEERQRTMRAAIAWSEELLAPEERVLFRRLSVFVGGCTLEAAETVCSAPEGAAPLGLDVLDGLGALVEQSLVQTREEGGERRFWLLHVIREYALEQLEASGEAEALRRAYAASSLALAEQAGPEHWGLEARTWLDRMEREHDNLRAALSWAQAREEAETGLRLAAALFDFWAIRGHLREGRAWLEGLLAMEAGARLPAGTGVQARALFTSGLLAVWQGDTAAAEMRLEQARALGQAADDQWTVGRAANSLGILALRQGDRERAAAYFADTLAVAREAGDQMGIATALNNLGDVAFYQGDLERAAAAFTETLARCRQVGDRDGVAVCLTNLGEVARRRGELDQAQALGREALAVARDLGNLFRGAEALEHLASTAGAAGQGERAARLLGAASALREALGAPQPAQDKADVEQAVVDARAALGEAAWAAAFAAGQAMMLQEAIAEALAEANAPLTASEPRDVP
jgi:predicted ATPase/DNA-binding XRE family transcriptional regulator